MALAHAGPSAIRATAWEAFLRRLDSRSARVYARPVAALALPAPGATSSAEMPAVAGTRARCVSVELVVRDGGETHSLVAPPEDIRFHLDRAQGRGAETARRRCEALLSCRLPFAGVALDRPRLVGIVNVTPDSFSDGGRFFDAEAAVAHGRALAEAGADVLDVGGESTRPGAEVVSTAEELRRVLPVIEGLKPTGLPLSIDTRKAAVMAAALDAGAAIVNDVSALTHDPEALGVVAARKAGVILMHMRGTPETMQNDPRYDDALYDVFDYLEARVAACREAGVEEKNIAVDPGIGFGKTPFHNARLVGGVGVLHGLGTAVMLGASRKSFIGALSRGEGSYDRLAGSLAAALLAVGQGVQLLRVHDVAATRQALALWARFQDAAGGTQWGDA